MQAESRPVRPQLLGVIGEEHIRKRFELVGVDPETFSYKRRFRDDNGLPAVIEVAFGYCPKGPPERRLVLGVNWSVGINNPFRQMGAYGQSLDSYLQQQRVGHREPVVLLIHLASPRIIYTDRGKSSLALSGRVSPAGDDNG